MATFLWKHKIFSLLLFAAIAYFFINPAGKFGFGQKNLVIYNRIPISFFDLTITVTGSAQPIEDLAKKDALTDFLIEIAHKPDDETLTLVVGTGFDAGVFHLDDATALSLEAKNITVRQLPSKEAMVLYNSQKDKGANVAVILCLKH